MTRFTGFFELRGPGIESEVSVTISYVEIAELLERLRLRLEAVPPGAHVRIDLIAWDGEA